jgi:hypothetical protein
MSTNSSDDIWPPTPPDTGNGAIRSEPRIVAGRAAADNLRSTLDSPRQTNEGLDPISTSAHAALAPGTRDHAAVRALGARAA